MNKPIYKEYSNLRGDNLDPDNTAIIQGTEGSDSQSNSVKAILQKHNEQEIVELNMISSSTSNYDKKDFGPDQSTQNKVPQLIVNDSKIALTDTDRDFNRGMLSKESIQYQKKRIQLRQPTYTKSTKSRKKLDWESEAMKKWKKNINSVLFLINMKRQIKYKKPENTITKNPEPKIELGVRIKQVIISILKFFLGLFLALIISALLLPFIYISDLFLRVYTYNRLYYKYAKSQKNYCYKVIFMLQIYVFLFATIIAIITNLYQTFITIVELIYNIVVTIQHNMSDLTNLLFQTINTPFSK